MAHALKVRLNLMHVALVTTLALGYSANPVLGQELIGLSVLPGDTTITVVAIDPVTGTQTPVLATSAIGTGQASNGMAIDPASRRVFFLSLDPGQPWLYIADLVRRTVSTVPNTNFFAPLWDPVGNRLLGLTYLPGESTVTVASIDLVTGAVTPLVATNAPGAFDVVIDAAGGRVFFLWPSNDLYVVDLTNRTVSQKTVSCCVGGLVWDPARSRLLGVGVLNNTFPITVFSVDPSTGSQTSLLPTPSGGVSLGYVTMDPATSRVLFADPFAQTLVTANLQNGNVSQSPLAPCCPELGWLPGVSVAVPALDARGAAILVFALALLGGMLATRGSAR